jgi:hypothetical protein
MVFYFLLLIVFSLSLGHRHGALRASVGGTSCFSSFSAIPASVTSLGGSYIDVTLTPTGDTVYGTGFDGTTPVVRKISSFLSASSFTTTVASGASFSNPKGVALSSNGTLFVADESKGIFSLPVSTYVTSVVALPVGVSGPRALAIGPNQSLLMTSRSRPGTLFSLSTSNVSSEAASIPVTGDEVGSGLAVSFSSNSVFVALVSSSGALRVVRVSLTGLPSV